MTAAENYDDWDLAEVPRRQNQREESTAFRLQQLAHGQQYYAGEIPYLRHTIGVADLVRAECAFMGYSERYACLSFQAALMHDVFEDAYLDPNSTSPVKMDATYLLEQGVPVEVVVAVLALTKRKSQSPAAYARQIGNPDTNLLKGVSDRDARSIARAIAESGHTLPQILHIARWIALDVKYADLTYNTDPDVKRDIRQSDLVTQRKRLHIGLDEAGVSATEWPSDEAVNRQAIRNLVRKLGNRMAEYAMMAKLLQPYDSAVRVGSTRYNDLTVSIDDSLAVNVGEMLDGLEPVGQGLSPS